MSIIKKYAYISIAKARGFTHNLVNALKNFNLEKVKKATLFNLDYTLQCIKFCLKNNYIYRVSSSVIPYPDLWNWKEDRDVLEKLKDIKKYIWLFKDFDVEIEAKKKEKALKKIII